MGSRKRAISRRGRNLKLWSYDTKYVVNRNTLLSYIIYLNRLRSANPPAGSSEDPVVNCKRRERSSGVKFWTAVQNQERTLLNSSEYPIAT